MASHSPQLQLGIINPQTKEDPAILTLKGPIARPAKDLYPSTKLIFDLYTCNERILSGEIQKSLHNPT